ncbi:MAG: hypothetical protein M1819_002027 [Sarea resinae]|nr:MAG: hypothetical protein M1819_002027 [Sarea resinae]
MAKRTFRERARAFGTLSREYFQIVWLDLLSMILIASSMWGFYNLPMNRRQSRFFEVHRGYSGSIQGDHYISHPLMPQMVTSLIAATVCLGVPIVVIALFQCRLRSVWDTHAAVTGLLKALIIATFVQVIFKNYIGGFRPNFLELCRPDPALVPQHGSVYLNVDACTGSRKMVTYGGHTAAAFASGVYLALYINAKLKVMSDHAPHFWRPMVMVFPLIGATLIAGGLTVDKHHQTWDILAGATIGTIAALVAYRVSYASLFNYTYNHIPVPPQSLNTHLDYVNAPESMVANELVFDKWWGAGENDAGEHGFPVTARRGSGGSGDRRAGSGSGSGSGHSPAAEQPIILSGRSRSVV